MSRYTDTVRYASSTTGVNFEKWLTWGAIAGIGYVVYKFVSAASDARDKVGEGIANAYVAVTAGPKIEALGNVILPDGRKIPMSKIAAKPDFTFVYGNIHYKLTRRRADNDYDSVRV